jgi:hypothetical protein
MKEYSSNNICDSKDKEKTRKLCFEKQFEGFEILDFLKLGNESNLYHISIKKSDKKDIKRNSMI